MKHHAFWTLVPSSSVPPGTRFSTVCAIIHPSMRSLGFARLTFPERCCNAYSTPCQIRIQGVGLWDVVACPMVAGRVASTGAPKIVGSWLEGSGARCFPGPDPTVLCMVDGDSKEGGSTESSMPQHQRERITHGARSADHGGRTPHAALIVREHVSDPDVASTMHEATHTRTVVTHGWGFTVVLARRAKPAAGPASRSWRGHPGDSAANTAPPLPAAARPSPRGPSILLPRFRGHGAGRLSVGEPPGGGPGPLVQGSPAGFASSASVLDPCHLPHATCAVGGSPERSLGDLRAAEAGSPHNEVHPVPHPRPHPIGRGRRRDPCFRSPAPGPRQWAPRCAGGGIAAAHMMCCRSSPSL
jgi:hypothetical protein